MALNLDIPSIEPELTPKITVIGVGGAGGNAVNNMIQGSLEGVEFLIANTDAQAIAQSQCSKNIQLGRKITQGLGAGSRPDVGQAAAEEALDEILGYLEGSNMVFITAGMGGGTGTGAAPVIARAAREAGILTVGVVTKPFHFEGVHRMRLADAGIEELSRHVDTLIIIPNQNLFRIANEKTTFADAFKLADDVLRSGVSGVTDLMMMPGLINLDFADIRSVMTEMGKAMMGTGEAAGENRALEAAEAAISNPLLDEVSMKGARGVLINITGGMDLTLFEVDEAANRIRDEVDPEANIIFGSTFDQSMEGTMRVSVVATGIDSENNIQPVPRPLRTSVTPVREEPGAEEQPAASEVAEGSLDTETSIVAKAAEITAAPQAISDVLSDAKPTAEQEPEQLQETASAAMATEEAETPEEAPAEAALDLDLNIEDQPAPELEAKVTETRDSFEAPKPVMPKREATVVAEPAPQKADPFAESDMTNASGHAEEKKGLGLFGRLTGGAARALQAATQASEPTIRTHNEPTFDAPATGEKKPAASRPQQQTLSGMDTESSSTTEEDLLDIPAFLRRQAN
ncbi:cell division protein FtsZ [Kiloniella sp. b19]|uniref:cell division protein FtsZ n=1 Tax=Kiloniella sp. GXU_MW_B19 TaxID=3141326 RepID=UPI0031D3434A